MSEENNTTNNTIQKPIYENGKYKCPNCNSELNNDELASGRCFNCNTYFDFDYNEISNNKADDNNSNFSKFLKNDKGKSIILVVLSVAITLLCSTVYWQNKYNKLASKYSDIVSTKNDLQYDYDKLLDTYENTESTTSLATTTETTTEIPTAPLTNASTNSADAGCEVTKYMWNSSNYKYVAIQVKNTTNDTIDINASFLLKDSSGNIVGVKSADESAIAPQQEIVLYSLDDVDFVDFDYKVSTEISRYSSVFNEATITDNMAENKVIVSATNNGNKELDYLKASVLYFSNGSPVYVKDRYLTGNNNALMPGSTEYAELEAYTTFDSYKVFITGRCSKY